MEQQRTEEGPPVAMLPPELLTAIFRQLVPSTATDESGGAPQPVGAEGDAGGRDRPDDDEGGDMEVEGAEAAEGGGRLRRRKELTRVEAALRDVLSSSAVCTVWREVLVKDNHLWKHITLARWRVWEDDSWRDGRALDWRSLHMQRVTTDKKVYTLLDMLARLSTRGKALESLHELGMDIWEKLTTLTAQWEKKPLQHIGLLYHANICIRELSEQRLKGEWKRLLAKIKAYRSSNDSSDEGAVDIEEGAILIAAWERMRDLHVREKVYRRLDEIAGMAMEKLRSEEEGDDVPASIPGKQVLESVNATLYDDLGFQGNTRDYLNADNSFIDRIVMETKKGIPITLSVIYAAVCRRLNVHIDMIGMPGHFVVKYTSPEGEEVFIDAFSSGRQMTREDCREMLEERMMFFSPEVLNPVGHIAVYERMLANLLGVYQRQRQTEKLLGVAKQLMILRGENSAEDLLTCARLHILLDQFDEARPLVEQVISTSSNPARIQQAHALLEALNNQVNAQTTGFPRRRDAGSNVPRFFIGQVMHHKKHAYRGAIYSWDAVCSASPEWMEEMRVDELPRGRNQPFYGVLVDIQDKPGNWTTYVAEENIIIPDYALPVEHAQVGAYFDSFHEETRRFIPNAELRSRYPDDLDHDGHL